MRYILIILLLSATAHGQMMTIDTYKGIKLNAVNRGVQVGYFRFDSTAGKFTRSGNQVILFRMFTGYVNDLKKRMELADNVLRWIDSTGHIQYPIEYMEDLRKWQQQNRSY